MRKSKLKEGPIEYYHVYPKEGTSQESVVVKLQNGKLESLTSHLNKEISVGTLNRACGIKLENGKLIVNEEYNFTEISLNRAYRKSEDFKKNGSPKWLCYDLVYEILAEVTM